MRKFTLASIAITGLLSACATGPSGRSDLVISNFTSSAYTLQAGDTMRVSINLSNIGGSTKTLSGNSSRSIGVSLSLFTNSATSVELPLTNFLVDDLPLRNPDETSERVLDLAAPHSLTPGSYDLCALADHDDQIQEKSEKNNLRCITITISENNFLGTDLMIENVEIIEVSYPKVHLKITVKNIGTHEANSAFRTMAFSRYPRWPLLFEKCQAITKTSCNATTLTPQSNLGPGESVALEGWFTFGRTDQRQFEWTGTPPAQANKPVIIDLMVDGCFAKTDSPILSQSCFISELDELNNFYTITFESGK